MLKKAIIICSLIATFFIVGFPKKPVFQGEGDYVLYLNSASSLACSVEVEQRSISKTYSCFKNVSGECLKARSQQVINDELIRLNAKFVFSEKGDDFETNYYYSDKISGYKTINGKKINIQTACRADNYIIATPMIFGGF
ncbi:MAG: hypothetical protein ACI4M6_03585 [Christensenellaceae bacterium]